MCATNLEFIKVFESSDLDLWLKTINGRCLCYNITISGWKTQYSCHTLSVLSQQLSLIIFQQDMELFHDLKHGIESQEKAIKMNMYVREYIFAKNAKSDRK